MARRPHCWSHLREQNLVWLWSPDRLKDDAVSAALAADGLEVGCTLWPEEMDSANRLKLSIPFFTDEQVGAASMMGPMSLDTIVAFGAELKAQLTAVKQGRVVCVCCSDRTGARTNSLLLVGAYLLLECDFTAKAVIRELFPPKLGFTASGLRFPLPWAQPPQFSEDSLTLADCFFGLEASSEYSWWDYKTHDPAERLQTTLCFDAVRVCTVSVVDIDTEEGCTMSLWVSADPVTTVKDPHLRPEPPEEEITVAIQSPASSKLPGTPKGEILSNPSGKSLKSGEFVGNGNSIRFRRGKSHLSKSAAVDLDPMSEWQQRAPTPTAQSKALLKKKSDLPERSSPPQDRPGKNAALSPHHPQERPADLQAFADWLKAPLGCQLIVRANKSDERGLPGGSYGDFFSRRSLCQLDVPFTDGTAPPNKVVEQVLAEVSPLLEKLQFLEEFPGTQHAVVVHCKSGLGRSMSLIGALAVTLTPDLTAAAYFGWTRLVRPGAIQTASQEHFLRCLDQENWRQTCARCFGWRSAKRS